MRDLRDARKETEFVERGEVRLSAEDVFDRSDRIGFPVREFPIPIRIEGLDQPGLDPVVCKDDGIVHVADVGKLEFQAFIHLGQAAENAAFDGYGLVRTVFRDAGSPVEDQFETLLQRAWQCDEIVPYTGSELLSARERECEPGTAVGDLLHSGHALFKGQGDPAGQRLAA